LLCVWVLERVIKNKIVEAQRVLTAEPPALATPFWRTPLLFCASAFLRSLKSRSAAVELYLKAMPDIENVIATSEDEVFPPKSSLQPSTARFQGLQGL